MERFLLLVDLVLYFYVARICKQCVKFILCFVWLCLVLPSVSYLHASNFFIRNITLKYKPRYCWKAEFLPFNNTPALKLALPKLAQRKKPFKQIKAH